MNKFLLTSLLLLFSLMTFAQVGIVDDSSNVDDFDTTPVNEDALLELRSSDGYLLLPRLTTSDIDALTGTAGMVVYDKTLSCFKGFDGTSWNPLGGSCAPPPSTTIQFSAASATVNEGDGSTTLTLTILNEGSAATTADIVLTSGDAADLGGYTTQSISFPGGSNADQTVSITISEEDADTVDEDYIFEIQNVAGGTTASAGTPSSFTLTVEDNDTPPPACTTPIDLANFDFSGNVGDEVTVNASPVATGITSAIISRGAGINATNNANRFNANGFTQPDLNAAIANDDYFQVELNIDSGYEASLVEIVFNWQKSSSGPGDAVLRSSVDGYASDLATFSGMTNASTHSAPLTGHDNLTGTVTFRLYVFGNTNNAGSGGFEGSGDDFVIKGCAEMP